MGMEWFKSGALLGAILYTLLGVAMFWISFSVLDRFTPYKLWEELIEKQNIALAIVVGLMSLGICLIVAAAIHG